VRTTATSEAEGKNLDAEAVPLKRRSPSKTVPKDLERRRREGLVKRLEKKTGSTTKFETKKKGGKGIRTYWAERGEKGT